MGDVVPASGALRFSIVSAPLPPIATLADAYAVPVPRENDFLLVQYLRAVCAAAERAEPGSEAALHVARELRAFRAKRRDRLAGVRVSDGYTLDTLTWLAYAKVLAVAHGGDDARAAWRALDSPYLAAQRLAMSFAPVAALSATDLVGSIERLYEAWPRLAYAPDLVRYVEALELRAALYVCSAHADTVANVASYFAPLRVDAAAPPEAAEAAAGRAAFTPAYVAAAAAYFLYLQRSLDALVRCPATGRRYRVLALDAYAREAGPRDAPTLPAAAAAAARDAPTRARARAWMHARLTHMWADAFSEHLRHDYMEFALRPGERERYAARYPGVRVPAHAVLQQFRPEDAVSAEDASSVAWEEMLAGTDSVAETVLYVRTLDAYLRSAFNYEFEREAVRWRSAFERDGIGDVLTPQLVLTFNTVYVYVPRRDADGRARSELLLVECAGAPEAALLWTAHMRAYAGESEYDMSRFYAALLDAPAPPRVTLPARAGGAFVFTL